MSRSNMGFYAAIDEISGIRWAGDFLSMFLYAEFLSHNIHDALYVTQI